MRPDDARFVLSHQADQAGEFECGLVPKVPMSYDPVPGGQMRHALYVVGVPGVGKSTLVDELTRPWVGAATHLTKPVAHVLYEEARVVELGKKRSGFPGTDTLSMSAITAVDPWVREEWWQADKLLGEGDRLAVDRFFTALEEGGWSLVVAHLWDDVGLAPTRRTRRAEELGTPPQKESWVKGRETKVERLVERWKHRVVTVRASWPFDVQCDALAAVSPVADALYQGPRNVCTQWGYPQLGENEDPAWTDPWS